jgi:hypothetical protein
LTYFQIHVGIYPSAFVGDAVRILQSDEAATLTGATISFSRTDLGRFEFPGLAEIRGGDCDLVAFRIFSDPYLPSVNAHSPPRDVRGWE